MKTEKSCGAVVFTKEDGYLKFLIIRSQTGFYGFPKGHMESAETEIETALREIKEETGLQVQIIDGFRTEDNYPIQHNGIHRMKQVVYFLAEYSGQAPAAQETEISSIHLMCMEEAFAVLQFDSLKTILMKAQAFLSCGV